MRCILQKLHLLQSTVSSSLTTMFSKLLVLLPFAVTGVLSQTAWFTFYSSASCNLDGFAGNCQGWGYNECCSGSFFSTPFFQSLDTENWNSVPAGALTVGYSGNDCSETDPVGSVTPGFCLSGGASSIGAAQLVAPGAPARKRDDTPCTPVPFSSFFYTPGDGFKYTVNATTHRANLEHLNTTQAVEKYIVDNYDEKTPI